MAGANRAAELRFSIRAQNRSDITSMSFKNARPLKVPATPADHGEVVPIEDSESLRVVRGMMHDEPLLALDTEFTRKRTYYSKLELIQIVSKDAELCVDARLCADLAPLSELFESSDRTFILHSASQDLDALVRVTGVPRRIFDTQIAAAICGLDKLSFREVVRHCTGILLSKGMTRSDWSRRPLLQDQLSYAMDDARFLLPVHDKLSAELASLDRTHWLEEECERAIAAAIDTHAAAPEDAWKRFGSGARLAPPCQEVARQLVVWRERRARRQDMPVQWVLRDEYIIDMAENPPGSPERLAARYRLGKGGRGKWVREIAEIANAPRDASAAVVWAPFKPLSDAQKRLTGQILSMTKSIAQERRIPAGLICNRGEAERLARKGRGARLLSGWRREIVEEKMRPFLAEAFDR